MKSKTKKILFLSALGIIIISISSYALLERNENVKQEYIELFGLDSSIYSVTSIDSKDSFALVAVSDGFVPAVYYVQHKNSGNEVVAGPLQEQPLCSVMNNAGVPEELYGECYLDK